MSIARHGAALDPTTWPDGWRDDWEMNERSSPQPQAWHRCGLCFYFEFEPVDEAGSWSWVVHDDCISESRLYELRAELGDEAFFKLCTLLGEQAKARWLELGNTDFRLSR